LLNKATTHVVEECGWYHYMGAHPGSVDVERFRTNAVMFTSERRGRIGCYKVYPWCYPWCYRTFSFTLSGLLVTVFLFGAAQSAHVTQVQSGYSLRFYGSDTSDRDRVKIPLGSIDNNGRLTNSYPINLTNAFTIEFWMKAIATNNNAPACPGGWYTGNIIIDRDVFGAGDYGDYGVAICDQRLVVGVSVGTDDRLLIGNTVVTDGVWHHIAITRAESGQIRLFVDGQLDGELNGAVGRIDYRTNRPTGYPNSDPYLVLGAEKHDYSGSRYYNGLLDDLRFSRVVRYTTPFARPTAPHTIDADTVALYRFDEGSGVRIGDSAPGGVNTGELKPRSGGAAQHWSTDTPFSNTAPTSTIAPTATGTNTPTAIVPSPTATGTNTPTAIVPSPTATGTNTPTAIATTSPTATGTNTPTAIATTSPTATGTNTPTAIATTSPTATGTNTPTAIATISPTATGTNTPTAIATISPTATGTNTPTAIATISPTATSATSPTATYTIVPTASQTPSVTPSIGSVVPTPHIRVYVPLITYSRITLSIQQ